MSHKRKAYTPFSTSSEAGTTTAPVEGYIDVTQDIRPIIDTGFVDSKGIWQGHVTSDKEFIAFGAFPAIANGGTILAPYVNADGTWPLDMTGYSDIVIAIKPTNGGNIAITAVMGPATVNYANLNPVNAAATLKGAYPGRNDMSAPFYDLLSDTGESLTVDVWNIFMVQDLLKNQKLLQFKIVNNSGDISTIETAFMRIV